MERLKELLYDISREKDDTKIHKMIWDYALKYPLDDLQSVIDIQCSNGNWNYDEYMFGLANGLILAQACILGKEANFMEAPKGFIKDREEDEKALSEEKVEAEPEYDYNCGPDDGCNFCCSDSDIDKPADIENVEFSEFAEARKQFCKLLQQDDEMKFVYMANIRMFLTDRDDFLHPEEVIYDLIDYLFKE